MAINIEVGITDGFRYIGVQPPLTGEQRVALQEHIGSQATARHLRFPRFFPIGARVVSPDVGQPYDEFGFMTSGATNDAGEDIHMELAREMAEVLSAVDTVSVDPDLKPIGYGYFLFGGQSNRLG